MKIKTIILFTVLTIVLTMILPVRFTSSSFVCEQEECESIGQYTYGEEEEWHWFGGYNMWVWGAFNDNDSTQAHWAKYGYTGSDAIALIVGSSGLAAVILFFAVGRQRYRVDS